LGVDLPHHACYQRRAIAERSSIADKPSQSQSKKALQVTFGYSYVGIFFGVAIVIGYFGGRWLDGRFHTAPWIGLVGLLIGITSGFRELYRISRQYQRDQKIADADAQAAKRKDQQK